MFIFTAKMVQKAWNGPFVLLFDLTQKVSYKTCWLMATCSLGNLTAIVIVEETEISVS